MNIPAVEAEHDLRAINNIGAAFSGKDDKYQKHLFELAWSNKPSTILKAKTLLAVTQRERGNVENQRG